MPGNGANQFPIAHADPPGALLPAVSFFGGFRTPALVPVDRSAMGPSSETAARPHHLRHRTSWHREQIVPHVRAAWREKSTLHGVVFEKKRIPKPPGMPWHTPGRGAPCSSVGGSAPGAGRPGPESGCSQAESPLICCKSQSPLAWELGPERRVLRAPREHGSVSPSPSPARRQADRPSRARSAARSAASGRTPRAG
jgi:hypothetical protein